VKILLIDNFDSFTYNLYHYLEACEVEVEVFRNNEITLSEVALFDKIVLSPGPGLPKNAGIMPKVIEEYHHCKPILGVCLGMQAIGEFFGDDLYNMEEVKHGISDFIHHFDDDLLFKDIPRSFQVGLYHSWAVRLKTKSPLIATAKSLNNTLMALKHKSLPIYGVQFHPESVLTKYGKQMLKNFVSL
jgi:anthranilate synthase component II